MEAIKLEDLKTLHYSVVNPGDNGIAVVTLDRPEMRNAQNNRMTYEMNACFDDAATRSDVKVIILQADGPHFCSGHDLKETEKVGSFDLVFPVGGLDGKGQEAMMAGEEEVYLNMTWRWRNLPKPLIAAAQGKTIAGGLPLLWAADIIVASDDAIFSDPVVAFGVNGVEYFAHPWEVGPRKAKEMLFTGAALTAQQAEAAGMVNKVVPLDELVPATLALAKVIAQRDPFALRMAKRAVNRTMEIQGYDSSLETVFDLHHFAHTRATVVTGYPSLAGLASMKQQQK